MNKVYHLFLDDSRMPRDVKWIELPLVAWTVVRNYKEFVEIIQRNGLPQSVTFDHDLADEHYQEYHVSHDERMLSRGTFRYDKMKEKTGYHCAKFLIEYCEEHNLSLPNYMVHSMNPIGKENIISLLESYRRSKE